MEYCHWNSRTCRWDWLQDLQRTISSPQVERLLVLEPDSEIHQRVPVTENSTRGAGDGAQRRPMEPLEALAYQEAGHSVFAWRYGYMQREGGLEIGNDGVDSRSPIRSEISSGVGQRLPPYSLARLNFERRSRVEAEIFLAGPLSEWRARRLRGELIGPFEVERRHHSVLLADELLSALGEAARVLGEFVSENEVVDGLRKTRDRVSRLLRQRETWRATELIAKTLLEERRLSVERTEALIFSVAPPRDLWSSFGRRRPQESCPFV